MRRRFLITLLSALCAVTLHAQRVVSNSVETKRIFTATDSSDHYANGAVMTAFKGKLYCMWQSSAIHEDSEDTNVVYSISTDEGTTWSQPITLAPATNEYYCTSGGWTVTGNTLTSFINIWQKETEPRGGNSYYVITTDGAHWSGIQPVMMADGSQMKGVLEQDPLTLDGGRLVGAAHFQPGLHVCPIYTDNPTGHNGWQKATFKGTDIGKSSREIEPSQYVRPDGSIVMLFRDQQSSFRKLVSVSADQGISWTVPTLTHYFDARTKQCAGNLPDGTAFMVSCPSGCKDRWPLVLQLSSDGIHFRHTILLRIKADLPPRRYVGRYKTLGYNYPKAFVWHNKLFICYSTNKENVECIIIHLN